MVRYLSETSKFDLFPTTVLNHHDTLYICSNRVVRSSSLELRWELSSGSNVREMANEQDTLDDENSHRIHLDHLDGGHSSFGAAAMQHQQGERPRVHGDNDLAVESASSPSAWSSCSRCGNRWSSPWHPTHAVVVDRATGSKFLWNARSHRKLRFPVSLDPDPHLRHHPRIAHQRWHVVSWEPHIVTWYICWVGVIANTLWVVNGLYATWPALARTVDPLLISYGTGVLGAFLFIVTGYLGFVEAINQTYSHVDLPRLSRHRNKILRNGTPTQFHAPVALLVYGQWPSPIGHEDLSTAQNRSTRTRLLQQGYPLVVDVQSQRLLTGPHLDNVSKTPDEKLIGRKVVIHVAGHVLSATIDECYGDHTPLGDLVDGCDASNVNDVLTGYRWWTWSPDLSYLGIFNAVAFFVSTIIFFIPACAWWPMAESGASLGTTRCARRQRGCLRARSQYKLLSIFLIRSNDLVGVCAAGKSVSGSLL